MSISCWRRWWTASNDLMNFKLHLLACAVLAYPLVGRAQEDGAQLPAALKDCIFLREESFKWYVQFDYEHEGKLFALLYAIGHDGKKDCH